MHSVIVVRLENIPDESIRHIAGVSKHQRRHVAMKARVVPVYAEPSHYFQLEPPFYWNIETDILRGRTVFPHYPRLHLQRDPRGILY